jgi:hypothetical protein
MSTKGMLLIMVWFGTACGNDVAGTFDIQLTNMTNGCDVTPWTEGMFDLSTLTLTQDGSTDTATLLAHGDIENVLTSFLGTNVFTGGDMQDANSQANLIDLDLKAVGMLRKSSGNCTWTFDAEITASLSNGGVYGRNIEGSLYYRASDDGNPDCAPLAIHGCETFLSFFGPGH